MSWLQRYLDLFQGEPGWLILLVTVAIAVGIFVILEKVLKVGVWLLIAGAVAVLVIFVGVVFVPGCGPEGEGEPVEAVEETESERAPESREVPEDGERDLRPREPAVPFQTPPLVPQ